MSRTALPFSRDFLEPQNRNSPIVILTHPEKGLGGAGEICKTFQAFLRELRAGKFGMHRHVLRSGPFCESRLGLNALRQ